MSKRRHKNEDSDYLMRKIRQFEKKLEKCRDHDQSLGKMSSSSSISPPVPLESESEHEAESVQSEVDFVTMTVDEAQPGTSTSAVETVVTESLQTELPTATELAVPPQDSPELDEEILNLLGEVPSKDKKYGPDIRSELAVRWEHIATVGLTKDSKKELLDKHLVPKNCTKIEAPKLNPEIKAALSEMLIKKDKALESKQKQVAASISCISEALTRLFSLEHKDQTVVKLLIEAGRLICDSQHKESMTRRNFICSAIKKDIKDQLWDTEIDSFLFGEKLADTLKAAKAISKSGAEIKIAPIRKNTSAQKPKAASAQVLNRQPPLPAARQAGAARRYEPTPTTAPRPRQPQQQRQPPRSQHQPGPRR